LNYVVGMCFPD